MTHPDAGWPTPAGTTPEPPAEVLAFGATEVLDTELPTSPRRRFGPARIAVAAGVTLALLVGVGAYAASMLNSGKRPEEFTPASVVAFAGLDLATSLEQQIKLLKVGTDLPDGVKDGKSLLESWLKEARLDGVDVRRDIISWLDKRVAVSLLPNGKDEPYALITAATTDDGKAIDGLKRLDAAVKDVDLGYVVRDGAALIVIGEGDAQAAATTAADEAAKHPLSDAPAFRDAVSKLDDNQLLTVWADFGAIGAMTKATGGERFMADAKGTLILGVRATTDGFDARYHLTGMAPGTAPTGGDALARVAALPGDTQVAAASKLPTDLSLGANNPASLLFGGFGGLGALGLLGTTGDLERLDDEQSGSGATGRLPGLTKDENAEFQKLVKKAQPTKAEQKRLEALMDKAFAGDGADEPTGNPEAELKKFLQALSGASVTVAVNHAPDKPAVRVVAEAASSSAATTLADLLKTLPADDLLVEPAGSTVTVTANGYTAGAGKLGDKPEFQRATADGPANADVVVYAELATVMKSTEDPIPVKSVALLQATSGDTTSGLIRVIVG